MSDDYEYAAIKTIHKQLDDNADGSVDFKESEEVHGEDKLVMYWDQRDMFGQLNTQKCQRRKMYECVS